MKCITCGTETENQKFCSRSCSATFNNKAFPKRKSRRTCSICGEPSKSWTHDKCEKHWLEYKESRWRNKTIGEYRTKQSVLGKHPSWLHGSIRGFARSWLKHLTKLSCAHCGYDKHVELAHIKDISSFPNEALLSEVNSPDNIIQLCPNCHWEFDNLPIEEKSQ